MTTNHDDINAENQKPEAVEDFASMLAEFDQGNKTDRKRRQPHVGDTIRGRILSIGSDAAFVDLGAKSDGMIELAELRDAKGQLTVAVGDTVEARIVQWGGPAGCIVLKRQLGRGSEAKAELEQAHQLGIPVEGMVTGVNKGGVEVLVAGVRAFCPISQLDLGFIEDASSFIGQKLMFRITRYETTRRDANIVLSRRELLAETAHAAAAELRARLAVGQVLRGRVTTLKDYGAFIDLGGIEGMLHVSEIGFSRVAHPSEVLSVGQEVEVQILKIEQTADPKRPEKISLSLKSLAQDPWESASQRYVEGTRHPGKVMRLESFGAFVELEPGIEGLLHVSELAQERQVKHTREVAKIGQTFEVTVLGFDRERRRISLSLAAPDPEAAQNLALGVSHHSMGTLGDLLIKKSTKKK